MSAQPAVAADWYADPSDPSQLRWWDGAAWTDHVAPAQPQEPAPAAAEPEASEPEAAGIEPTTPALSLVPEPLAEEEPVAAAAVVPEPAAHAATPEVAFPVPTPEVAAAPTQLDAFMAAAPEEQQVPAAKQAKSSRSAMSVDPKLLVLVGVVLVAAAAYWFVIRGAEESPAVDAPAAGVVTPAPATTDPAAAPVDPAAAAPTTDAGTAVPGAVDAATGNGISQAAELAGSMQANLDAAAATPAP